MSLFSVILNKHPLGGVSSVALTIAAHDQSFGLFISCVIS